jgi:hypothetical protein
MLILTTPYSDPSVTQTKASAGGGNAGALNVYNFNAFNPDASAIAYLQLFDATSANVTVGTTVATKVIALPPKGGVDTAHIAPMRFSSGRMTYAATATPTGAGAPSTPCILSLDFNY